MPSLQTVVAFVLTGMVLVVVPGPSVLFIVGRALTYGRRAALVSVAGNMTGVLLVVGVVALGFGAVAAHSIEVFTVLKLVGAAYLVYLGVQTFRHRGELAAAVGAPAEPLTARIYRQAVVVGVTNPKALVLFAAILPQFTDPAAGAPGVQMAVLGTLFTVLAAGVDAVYAVGAGAARSWLATSPKRVRRLGASGGVLMVALGTGLAVATRE
ncbi:LysE family translocator [Pseudonocardia sp. CA-107938]|uniref:LysE family translocator n=1 Tax=Pseudonocardia sp. CA-107938 TaxID=3240021 RepID=UPI003D8A6887